MKQIYHKIHYFLSLAAMLPAIPAIAVPAKPVLQPTLQSDGSMIMTRLSGDEHSHFVLSEDNLPIEKGKDGLFYYYNTDNNGKLILSSQRVISPRTDANEKAFVSSIDRKKLQEVFALKMEALTSGKRVRRNLPPKVSGFPCTGSPRGLVLLIEYSDVAFTTPDANNAFSRMLNEEGYSDLGASGSARDWFIANSGGKFTPDFDVIGPIRLEHPRAYYGANKGGNDVRPEMMIIEACGLIADEVDFSKYDEDDDGYIDNVFAFYAGYGENLGASVPSDCVWPHSWDIVDATSVPYYFNGKRLNHYACTNEIDLSDTMDGIGTFVHEFSHVMGLPDLYATNYSFAFTPGKWSVMDEGPYNNNSRTPPYYSAFERLSLGWLEPVRIDRPSNVKIPPIAENRAYWIATENENEYFLLENRQQTGWDTYIPYHGMLVWHIDYNENIWHYNTVNDRKDHQYVDIIEADNHPHDDTIEGDPFPGINHITSFTDDTEPAMRSWAGNACGVPLTDIFENNGYVYLKAMGGKSVVEPVVALPASEVEIDSFTARWEASDEPGCEYVLSVYTSSSSSSGQVNINYVEGYESLNLGQDITTHLVTGLEPGGEYRYSVRILDPETNMQSVSSNEIIVKLLPPTFDFLMPKALDATEVTSESFMANWESLEGADSYSVTVFAKSTGEPKMTECDFTGGLQNMPEGWTTNSKLTYAAEDYCGQDVPSLRFNTEGQYLEIPVTEGYVRGLRFWHRAIGTTPDANIEFLMHIAGEWKSALILNLKETADNEIIDLSEETLPYGADALRIVFHPSGKGSIAIDDIVLTYGGETSVINLPDLTDLNAGTANSILISGLTASSTYCYTVTAQKGNTKSKASNEIRVVTGSTNGMVLLPSAKAYWKFDSIRSHLTMFGLPGDEQIVIYSIDGRVLTKAEADDSGRVEINLPEFNGIAIFRATSGLTGKINR